MNIALCFVAARRKCACRDDCVTVSVERDETLIEGISRYHGGEIFTDTFHRIAQRRGVYKARVAVARKVLTLAYYGLRDGEIRALAKAA